MRQANGTGHWKWLAPSFFAMIASALPSCSETDPLNRRVPDINDEAAIGKVLSDLPPDAVNGFSYYVTLKRAGDPILASAEPRTIREAVEAGRDGSAKLDARIGARQAAMARTQGQIADIDSGIAALQARQAENPAKMDRLVRDCQTDTGAVMEGQGAMEISRCVNTRW